MSFLKKFGQAVLKIGQTFLLGEQLAVPFLGAAAPANATVKEITNDLTKIGQGVTTVETVFAAVSDPAAKTGAQKLQAASALTQQIVQSSELLAGKKVKDEAAFTKACQEITGGVADLLNAVE